MTVPLPLLQASDPQTLRRLVFAWPTDPLGWILLLGGFGLAAALIVVLQRRDTRELPTPVRALLLALRLSVLVGLLVVWLSPQERTTREGFEPSRVAILVDVSGSMQQPAVDPRTSEGDAPSRSEAARSLLAESTLLDELRKAHTVDVYTFGETLSETPLRLPYDGPLKSSVASSARGEGNEPDAKPPEIEWADVVEPVAASTRLGEAIEQTLSGRGSRRYAGVVVLSDGANNAGRDIRPANGRAVRDEVPLVAVGFGSTEAPINLQVTRLIGPTDVQAGDAFDVTAYLQGQGVAGQSVAVRLLRSPEGQTDLEREEVASERVTLGEEGRPVAVTFEQRLDAEGNYDYVVEANLPEPESRDDDNTAQRTIRIFDRPFEVLVVAGGPTRDYRFARNALFRHPSAEIDVWLQTGRPGISQESRELLFEFPATRGELFGYDVLVAFDVDWTQLTDEQIGWVTEWVSEAGGGLIYEIGDVHTPQLAGVDERLEPLRTLLPVTLEPVRLSITSSRDRSRLFPVALSPAGEATDFLQLEADEGGRTVWQRLPGLYSAYPTSGEKAGATVFARFPNPLLRGASGPPPLIAEQRYGQGTALYLGTSEFWRLRRLDEDVYDRLWVKLVRRAGQGRSRQGQERAVWLLDDRDQPLGQVVPLRLRLVSAQFEPLDLTELPVLLRDPAGQLVPGDLLLKQDPRRPTEYVGEFRPTQAGRYTVEVTPPDGETPLAAEVRVELPLLEASKLEQDAATLRRLVEETGGAYLTPEEAAEAIPALLPTAGRSVLIDRELRDLWDRWWVLATLVGLLGVEWLIRKFAALA